MWNNFPVFQGGRDATGSRQSKETVAKKGEGQKNLKNPGKLQWAWGNSKKDKHFLNDFSVGRPSRDSSRHLEVQFEEGLVKHIFWINARGEGGYEREHHLLLIRQKSEWEAILPEVFSSRQPAG